MTERRMSFHFETVKLTQIVELSFFAAGLPAPGGSKRGIFSAKLKRTLIFENNPQANRNWRAIVAHAANIAMQGRDLLDGPLGLHIVFLMPRPKNHFNSKGVLKQTAPLIHLKQPDAVKLTRSTEDSLTNVVWRDDAQVADLRVNKYYASQGCGALIEITRLVL